MFCFRTLTHLLVTAAFQKVSTVWRSFKTTWPLLVIRFSGDLPECGATLCLLLFLQVRGLNLDLLSLCVTDRKQLTPPDCVYCQFVLLCCTIVTFRAEGRSAAVPLMATRWGKTQLLSGKTKSFCQSITWIQTEISHQLLDFHKIWFGHSWYPEYEF